MKTRGAPTGGGGEGDLMGRAVDAFGQESVEALALLAIDLLCEPPVRIGTYTTSVRADQIRRGREIMEQAGIDWQALKGQPNSARAARSG